MSVGLTAQYRSNQSRMIRIVVTSIVGEAKLLGVIPWLGFRPLSPIEDNTRKPVNILGLEVLLTFTCSLLNRLLRPLNPPLVNLSPTHPRRRQLSLAQSLLLPFQ